MDKHLHIITHDIPFPADYGGVVDLFYKIKALYEEGVKIHLHCFYSDREKQNELLKWCASVDYYPRKKGLRSVSFSLPYIVKSRRDTALLQNLSADQYPILIEGIHCTYLLKTGALKDRKVFVRLHNVEYTYYRQLALHESNFLKKIYYTCESRLLKKYERSLANSTVFWAVNQHDAALYRQKFQAKHVYYLPVFVPWQNINQQSQPSGFCLYHGNLSVNENEKAADWLLNHVFHDLEIPFVIAGKNPSLPLQTLAYSHANTCMVANPSDEELQDLIQKAHINILPSFNKTGIKLKLLNALYNGKHCMVNKAGVEGTGLNHLCSIAETPEEFKAKIKDLMEKEITASDMQKRAQELSAIYDAKANARRITGWLY